MKTFKKAVFIAGVTGYPYFLTTLAGHRDAKSGAVQVINGKPHSHAIEKKVNSLAVFNAKIYYELASTITELYEEFDAIVIRYNELKRTLEHDFTNLQPPNDDDVVAKRLYQKVIAQKTSVKSELMTLEKEMTVIDNQLTTARVTAEEIQLKASALTLKRIHAYLHGAAAVLKTPIEDSFALGESVNKPASKYDESHKDADDSRRILITAMTTGIEMEAEKNESSEKEEEHE